MKRLLRIALIAGAGLVCLLIVVAGAAALVLSSQARNQSVQPVSVKFDRETFDTRRAGKVVLDLNHADVTVEAGAPGSSLEVFTSYDREYFAFDDDLAINDDGEWMYEAEFDAVGNFHILTRVREVFGAKRPRVIVKLPPEQAIEFEGYFGESRVTMDYAGLDLSRNRLHVEAGRLNLIASEPSAKPTGPLKISLVAATMESDSLGNASPESVELWQHVGGLEFDLTGAWRRDTRIEIDREVGGGRLLLPDNVRIEGFGLGLPVDEMPGPTLFLDTNQRAGRLETTVVPD